MQKYKVVLLGGSNSMMKGALRSGLEQENIELTNLALGGTGSLQNLYELKLPRNQEAILGADVVVTESNINDIVNHNKLDKTTLEVVIAGIECLYAELARLNKKVLVLILPFCDEKYSYVEVINNVHRACAKKYGFNVVDVQHFYEENGIMDFYMRGDLWHQIKSIMKQLGENIARHLDLLKTPKNISKNINEKEKVQFTILSPKDMEVAGGGGNYKLMR